jgi:hypothetical protein
VSGDGRLEVRSYRSVFDFERRLYRIDRLRLNPGGVPVRAIVYALVVAVVVAAIAALPVLGWPLRVLPWPARQLLLPTLLAAALTAVRIDGRPCHVALRSLVALALGARRIDSWQRAPRSPRWCPPDLVVIPDGSESGLRRSRYRGPGAAVVAIAHEVRRRPGRRAVLRPKARGDGAERKVVVIAGGARLDIHPSPGR